MKKIQLLTISCVIFVLAASGVALAGQKSGPYLGGSLGSAGLTFDKGDFDFDDSDLGYKIFAGYNLGIIPLIDVGIEGSYVDFGEASDAEILDQDIGVTAWDLFAVGAVNLGPIGIFGKVGHTWWESDVDVFEDVLDKSGNDMVYGIGLRFQIRALAIRAEYEYFDLDLGYVGYYSAGVSWTF